MNPLAQGMALGYTGQQLLNFLTKAIPSLSPKISQAQRAGYSIEKIINFLGKTMEAQSYPKSMTQNQIHGQKTKEKEVLTKGLLAKGAALLGTGLATAAVSRALPTLASGLMQQGSNPPAPNQPTNPGGTLPISPTPQQPQPSAPTQQPQGPTSPIPSPNQPVNPQATLAASPSQQPPVNQSTPIVPNIQQTTQAEGNPLQSRQIPPLPPLLQKLAKDSLLAGNNIDQIAGMLEFSQNKVVRDYEKTTNVAIADAVKQFAETNPVQPSKLEPMARISESEAEQTQAKPIEKKSVVALPNGDIGEVTDIRQGIATVNADGKIRRRKISELIESPLPQKDLAELHDDLMKGIESKTGEEISKMVSFAGYDPKTNELAFLPHTGSLYVYDNISPEDAKQLTNILSKRKTSGENFMGAWTKDTKSPIGAEMSKLIQRLQKERGGKGLEYKNKYEKIYDALEPAKIETKEKYKEKQAANKEAKPKKEKAIEKKEPESKLLQKRFDQISKKLYDIKNKAGSNNPKIQAERIKELERLEKEYNKAWDELREQLIHEKEMGKLNEDIAKEKRKAKKPGFN